MRYGIENERRKLVDGGHQAGQAATERVASQRHLG